MIFVIFHKYLSISFKYFNSLERESNNFDWDFLFFSTIKKSGGNVVIVDIE